MQDIFVNFSLNQSLPGVMKLLSITVLTEKNIKSVDLFFSLQEKTLSHPFKNTLNLE